MQWKLKTAPTRKPLTVNQLKKHLCLTDDFTEGDVAIQDYLDASMAFVDGPNGVLGHCIINQTWTAVLDKFPDVFVIDVPPVQSVSEIRYIDVAGSTQIVSSSSYRVSYTGFHHQPALVETVSGANWPTIDDVLGAVEIDVVLGYGATPATVPHNIKQLIRMLSSSMFEEKSTVAETVLNANPVYQDMINNTRIIRFV